MLLVEPLLADRGNRQRHVLIFFGAVARGDRHFLDDGGGGRGGFGGGWSGGRGRRRLLRLNRGEEPESGKGDGAADQRNRQGPDAGQERLPASGN